MNEEKGPFVRRLFDTIAGRYDLFNTVSSLTFDKRWRRVAVEQCQLASGMRVLDLCTGTGELALGCAAAMRQEPCQSPGQVVGLDMSAPMLRLASRKAERRRQSIDWLFGDALGLPFRDGVFARVIVGFSTRNLVNLALALREIHRVLQPQGRLVILETGKPGSPLMRAGYFLYLRTVVVVIGFLLFGKAWPFTYLQQSVARFWEPHEFVRSLREIGFSPVTYRSLSGGIASLYVAVKT